MLGATLPGCPLFAVAPPRDLSWGVTYLKGDTSDYFIEDCKQGGRTGWQYRRGTELARLRRARGGDLAQGAAAENMRIYHNEQGTLESDPLSGISGNYLSIKWIGDPLGSGESIATWLEVVGASGTAEAMDLVARLSAAHACAGCSPIAMGTSARRPTAGFRAAATIITGCCRFRPGIHAITGGVGYRAACCRASTIRPKDSWPRPMKTSTPPGGPMLVTQPVPDYRKRRIVERLRELPAATLEDMQALQYDVVSLQARDLLAVFLPCMRDGKIKERLAKWDCSYSIDSYEATLFSRLYRNVLLEVFGHEQGIGWRRMLYLCSRVGFSTMVLTAIDRLLLKDDSLWWRRRDKAELIRRAADRLAGEKESAVVGDQRLSLHQSLR